MKIPSSIVVLLAAASASACLHAQTTDAPPVNVNSVLTTLNQLKQKQQADIKATEKTLAQTLMATASNPADALNYYMNAVVATQFSGQNHEAKEVQDWKKRNEPEFKDPNFRSALCLHLMYLSLTISHDSGVTTKDLLPNLVAYTQQVRQNETGLAGEEEFMETPLSKSIFVRSLEIGQYVTDNTTWELIPIKVDNIFQKVILPEYRIEKNSAGIFQYWDDRIQREEAAAGSLKHQVDIDKFQKVTKPSLEWQRAEEYVVLGQKNTAINTMVSIIQANRYHPDAPAWIDEVEKMVKDIAASVGQQQPAASATGATSAGPANAPAPVVANPDSGSTQPAQN